MSQAVILHVEDDSDDAFFVAYALGNAVPDCVVRHVYDGREAIDYLDGTAEFAASDHPKPHLVLLDLKLPDVNGFEVLQWIRNHAQLKDLQVFILSGSSVADDKERALRMGANGYFLKTPGYKDIVAFVGSFLQDRKGSPSPGDSEALEQPAIEPTAGTQGLS